MALSNLVSKENIEKILQPFALSQKLQKQAHDLIQSIYKILIESWQVNPSASSFFSRLFRRS